MLKGGYISFINEAEQKWQQILWVDPNNPPQLRDLGPATGGSHRVWIDNLMAEAAIGGPVDAVVRTNDPARARAMATHRAAMDKIATLRARYE